MSDSDHDITPVEIDIEYENGSAARMKRALETQAKELVGVDARINHIYRGGTLWQRNVTLDIADLKMASRRIEDGQMALARKLVAGPLVGALVGTMLGFAGWWALLHYGVLPH